MAKNLELKLILSGDGKQLKAVTQDAKGNIVELGRVSTNATASISKGLNGAGKDVKSFGTTSSSTTSKISSGMKGASSETVKLKNNIGDAKSIMMGFAGVTAGAFALDHIGVFAADISKTVQRIQDLDIRIRNLTKSEKDFAETQQFLSDLSQRQNKDLLTQTDSFSKLLALEKGGIITRQESKKLMEGMNDVSSSLGASNEQLKQSLFGLAQGFSSGTLRAEELNQVTEPLPGLLQELDRAAGLGAGGFRKLVNDGKVTSDFFKSTLIKSFEAYAGAAEATSETLTAKYTKIGNSYTALAKTLESPITSNLGPVLDVASDGIELITQNGDVLANTFAGLATITGGRLLGSFTKLSAEKLKQTGISNQHTAAIKQETQIALKAQAQAKSALIVARQRAAANYQSEASLRAVATAEATLRSATTRATTAMVAQTAITRTATLAQRGFNLAMGAMGGPVGLAMTAGILLYSELSSGADEATSRQELLNESINKTGLEISGLSALQIEIETDKATLELANLSADLKGLRAQQESMRFQVIGFDSAEWDSVNNQIDSTQDSIATLTGKIIALDNQEAVNLKDKLDFSTLNIAELNTELDNTQLALSKAQNAAESAQQQFSQGLIKRGELDRSNQEVSELTNKIKTLSANISSVNKSPLSVPVDEKTSKKINDITASLQNEIKQQIALTQSKLLGIDAVNNTSYALDAERKIRELGIDKTSAHADQIRNLSGALLQYNQASSSISATVEAENQSYTQRSASLKSLFDQKIISQTEYETRSSELTTEHHLVMQQAEAQHQAIMQEIASHAARLDDLKAQYDAKKITASLYNAQVENAERTHQNNLDGIKESAQKKELSGLQTFIQQKEQAEDNAHFKRMEALRVALDSQFITEEDYFNRVATETQNHENNLNLIREHSASEYIKSLSGIESATKDTAAGISNSMSGAAGNMAGSFQNAALLSIAAIQSIQKAQYNNTYAGVFNANGKSGYNSNGDYITGNPNDPYGFVARGNQQQADRDAKYYDRDMANPYSKYNRDKNNPYSQENRSYYHSGGIVGEDLGSKEVNATLLQGEGVFTENQMAAMMPVHSIMAAMHTEDTPQSLSFDFPQSSTNKGANFLAEYTRVNSKHVENFEIATVRHVEAISGGFELFISSMGSVFDTAFSKINIPNAASTSAALNSVSYNQLSTFSPSYQTIEESQPKKATPTTQAEKLQFIQEMMGGETGFDAQNVFNPYLKGNDHGAVENIIRIIGQNDQRWNKSTGSGWSSNQGDTAEDRFSIKDGVSFIIDPDAIGHSIADAGVLNVSKDGRVSKTAQEYDHDYQQYVDKTTDLGLIDVNTDTDALKKAGVSEHFIQQVKDYQEAVFNKLFADYQQDIKSAQESQPKPQATQPINQDDSRVTGAYLPENYTPQQYNPDTAPTGFFQSLEFGDRTSGYDLYRDLLKNSDDAYSDIADTSEKTWEDADDDLNDYSKDFADRMDVITWDFNSAMEEMRNNSQIQISTTAPSFSEIETSPAVTEPTVMEPIFTIEPPASIGIPVEPTAPINPVNDEDKDDGSDWMDDWNKPIFFHSGGIAGIDKSNREIDATLLKGEGVFTQAQMSALAPISYLNESQSSGNNVVVNVHEAQNTQTEIRQTEQPDGSIQIDVIARAVEGKIIRNMQSGGGIAKALQGQYGLRRGR